MLSSDNLTSTGSHQVPAAGAHMGSPAVTGDPEEGKKRLMTAGTIVTVMTAIVIIIFIVSKKASPRSSGAVVYKYCSSFECVEYGRLLNASLDVTQDPCNNFYRFVCNGWDRTHEKSVSHQHHLDHMSAIATKAQYRRVPQTGQSAVQKAAKFYQSCIELAQKNRSELLEFMEMLRNGNITWPSRPRGGDLLRVMSYACVHWNASPLLQFEIGSMPNGTTVVNIIPGSFVPVWEGIRQDLVRMNRYYEYFRMSYQLMGMPKPTVEVYNKFKATEDILLEILSTGLNDSTSKVFSEHDFQGVSSAFKQNRWRMLFEEVVGIPKDKDIAISLASLGYFVAYNEETRKLTEDTMIEFLSWGVIFELGPLFLPEMAVLTYKSKAQNSDAAMYCCLVHVEKYMGYALTMPYFTEAIPVDTQQRINRMYKTVSTVIEKRIGKLEFNYQTYLESKRAGGIFGGFNRAISNSALNERYATFPDMENLFTKNLLKAVAAKRQHPAAEPLYLLRSKDYGLYEPKEAVIHVSPFAMEIPFYGTTLSKAIRFGAIGSFLLTALVTDIFTNVVLQMTTENQKNLTSVTACLRNAISEGSPNDTTVYDAISVQLVKEAYDSSKKQERDGRLTGVPKYNEIQLMLIVTCYLRCSGSSSMHEDSCNVPMQNLELFTAAFSCSAGSPMSPEHKCLFFNPHLQSNTSN
ncbi:neprilysin-1-like [Ornithodoros turicata]|uniref:neprilysin-1-like n=1 Tax=Ornithodoros turicata TaxID=34597 RepID=UPI00313A1439